MKKLLILFMAFGLVAASCNNDKKANNDKGNTNRDKDDYNNRENDDNGNKRRDEDDDNGRGWSSADKRQWMNLCTSNRDIESLGETKATNYCECILDKMEKRFSSLQKADAEGGQQLGEQLGEECARELGYK